MCVQISKINTFENGGYVVVVLKIENLQKIYVSPDGNNNLIIDIPEFAIEKGEEIALQGTSGCGKTTFLHLIAGIIKASQGSVVVENVDICKLTEAERDVARANHVGYIFQTFNLLEGYTALENLIIAMSFGKKGVDKKRAKQLLEQVGLQDRMNYVPSKLSIGQKQRVAVARALVNQPKLVLADEPTGNLDTENAQEALSLIRCICEENSASLLLVSHDENIINKFTHLKKMKDINRVLTSEGIK